MIIEYSCMISITLFKRQKSMCQTADTTQNYTFFWFLGKYVGAKEQSTNKSPS